MNIYHFTTAGLEPVFPANVREYLQQTTDIVWIDIPNPDPIKLADVRVAYHLHPLAIEDVCNHQQRPKVEEYADHLFIIINMMMESQDQLHFHEVDVFLGRTYIVTAHEDSSRLVEEVKSRINREGNLRHISPDYLLYVLFDTVVDAFFPLLERLDMEIEDMNREMFLRPSPRLLNRVFKLRRLLNDVIRVSVQQREIGIIINRREQDLINHDVLKYYLRDVYDHLVWIIDAAGSLRDNLTAVLELYISGTSNRLNRVVNRLTIITITIGVLTVISGFYGMNFAQTWPPFDAPWGVPFVLLLMLVTTVTLLALMKWRKLF